MYTFRLTKEETNFSIFMVEDDKKDIWFSAKEIETSIGLTYDEQVKIRHNYPEKFGHPVMLQYDHFTQNGHETDIFMGEPALTTLLWYSDKPDSLDYLYWVISEAVPKLRNTGKYYRQNDDTFDRGHYLCTEEYRNYLRLQSYLEQNQHKIDFANLVECSPGSITVEEFAQLLQNGENCKIGMYKMHKWLRDKGYFKYSKHQKSLPLQKYINCGYFEIKYPRGEIYGNNGFSGPIRYNQEYGLALVTPKGQVALAQHICKEFKEQEESIGGYQVPIEVVLKNAENIAIPDNEVEFFPIFV